MPQMAHLAMRQSSPKQIFARSESTPLDAGILTYEFPQSVSEIYSPLPRWPAGAVVLVMVTTQIHYGAETAASDNLISLRRA